LTPDDATRLRPGAPLAVQIVALLIVGVVLAQAVTAVLILALPPPKPPVYRLTDVAAALQGGALRTSTGWSLTRSAGAAPSRPGALTQDEDGRDVLAAMLGASPDRVQLLRQRRDRLSWARIVMPIFRPAPPDMRPYGPPYGIGGPPIGGASMGDRPLRGPPPANLFRRPPPWDARFGHGPDGGRGPDPGCRPGMRDCRGDPLLFQGFVAGFQQPSGTWLVVRPPPEPFPNGWQRRILLWLAISVAVVAPMGYLFARRITAPLGAFARAADRFGKDPASPLMVLEGPAEIGVAARAFNDMQGRLKRYVEDRTAMVGAISHDLRTPLARIRFKLERAPPELKATLSSDVAQMEQMISAVLAFIRDASAASTREPLDLLSLLECTVDDAAMVGADASIAADWSPVVDGDPVALQRLFANLVDNAVKYGGCALITLHQVGSEVRVDVADRGPGLPDSELERVFEAFYRADRARNLDDGGIGLGLAVARSVAREHGGDVYLTCTGEGLTAHVQLPLRRNNPV
jgi:signal transduction histidine kinase